MDKKILQIVRSWFIDLKDAIEKGLSEVKGAVNSQEYPKNVQVNNLSEVAEPIQESLQEVVKVFKDEINKIDKEIKVNVKNDLPNLYKLFKQDKDKLDLIKAINELGKLIPKIPASKDYEINIKAVVLALGDVIKAIEKNKPKLDIDLKPVEKKLDLISRIVKEINFELPLDNNEVRVVINKKQFRDLYNATVSGTMNGVEERLDNINNSQEPIYPAGTGLNGSVTLTNANTAYAVPSTAPSKKNILTIYNNTGNLVYLGYENTNSGGAGLNSGGNAKILLGASQQVYAYSATAGTTITYTLKEI